MHQVKKLLTVVGGASKLYNMFIYAVLRVFANSSGKQMVGQFNSRCRKLLYFNFFCGEINTTKMEVVEIVRDGDK